MKYIYSRLSLSRPRLSRITAYLEVKIWSLFKHENLTTGNKILWKRGEISPRSHNIFNIYLQLQESNYVYICEMWLFDLFILNSANLLCRGTDISKYFRQSLGLRDNESRLYMPFLQYTEQNRTEQKFYSKFHKAIKPARIQTSTIRDGIWQCEYSYIHNNADLYLDYLWQ